MKHATCPDCRVIVREDAPQCPKCGLEFFQSGEPDAELSEPEQPSRPVPWRAIVLAILVVVSPFFAGTALWSGIILLLACIGAVAARVASVSNGPGRRATTSQVTQALPQIQRACRFALDLNRPEAWKNAGRLTAFAATGLLLVSVGWSGMQRASANEERARIESEANAEVATLVAEAESHWQSSRNGLAYDTLEKAQTVQNATRTESIQQLRARMANARVQTLVADAERAWKQGQRTYAEARINDAMNAEDATDHSPVEDLQTRIGNADVAALVSDTHASLTSGDIKTAQAELKKARDVSHATQLAEVDKLEQLIQASTSRDHVRSELMRLSDGEFERFRNDGVVPPSLACEFAGLQDKSTELARSLMQSVFDAREADRLARLEAARKKEEAEQKRREQDRLIAQAAARQEAMERERREVAAAEAARRAKEEYDANGLVLLRTTVTAKRTSIGVEITGVVENRRPRKLSVAQIEFSLFDDSGAQVGSATGIIRNLESRGRWRFKAVGLVTDFTKYRFAELTGF